MASTIDQVYGEFKLMITLMSSDNPANDAKAKVIMQRFITKLKNLP